MIAAKGAVAILLATTCWTVFRVTRFEPSGLRSDQR
jgi:hypothetical protein